MPRDSGGIYSLPAGYVAVSGETILPSQQNPPLEDIAAALTASLPRNGAAPMTGNLAMGTNKITGLGAGTSPADAVTKNQLDTVEALAGPQARADIASATTMDIGAEPTQYLRVTGTIDIESLGTAPDGLVRDLLFADALTLTHNATSLINITGANIDTEAGDIAQFRLEGSGNWRMTGYQRASGRPLSFAPDYDSGPLTITSGGSLDFNPGFGQQASLIQTWLRCITPEHGYSAGDEIMIDRQMSNTTNYGVSVYLGSDNRIYIRYGSATNSFFIHIRSTGAVAEATNANWRLIVRAWK